MPLPASTFTCQIAATANDFEQVFRLNHATFAAEIPQHAPRVDGRLIDRFHAENEYIICKHGEEVIGMLALRAERPFSLDAKLPDLDAHLPPGRRICEIRLLAVKPAWRHRGVLVSLVRALARRCAERRYDYAIISGTTRELKLYQHLGFTPFGPLTGAGQAMFQPMQIAVEAFNQKVAWLSANPPQAIPPAPPLLPQPCPSRLPALASLLSVPSLLTPGPVEMHAEVHRALAHRLQPHRSIDVMASLRRCRARLCALTQADAAQVLLGSGTLANDAVAQQLRARGPGLVLANGEFGERLIDHAACAALKFTTHRANWGTVFDFEKLGADILADLHVSGTPLPAWIWMVHCETSTGMQNDLPALRACTQRLGAELVLDCISAIGNIQLDLGDVLFATGVGSKGVGAPPGLSFVMHRRDALRPVAPVPRYLDLSFAAAQNGLPFTQSSALLAALDAALKQLTPAHYAQRLGITSAVHCALAAAELAVITPGASAAVGVVTIALPATLSPRAAAEYLAGRGFRVAYESGYLRKRRWLQIAWMGQVPMDTVIAAVDALKTIKFPSSEITLTNSL